MDLEGLYKYAYVKRPLTEIYQTPSQVPFEFLMEWFKDAFDYQRIHSDEEIEEMVSLKPESVLEWLEEAMRLCWEGKKALYLGQRTMDKTS